MNTWFRNIILSCLVAALAFLYLEIVTANPEGNSTKELAILFSGRSEGLLEPCG
jgi:hypothetical protein